ncbi:unnamed protein product [Durusdinium trenchii]|uniref:Uncharacterized protein n=1 Tax=Durusdinium trenchii TaxID=1381693 RepID=A0ABP0QDS1_9DINO
MCAGLMDASGYLQTLEMIDRSQLTETTIDGTLRLVTVFGDATQTAEAPTGSYEERRATKEILNDLSQNAEFSNVMEQRKSIVLVRGALGHQVAQFLCRALDMRCSIIWLLDLPQDFLLARAEVMANYSEDIKSSRAVLILPFDRYDLSATTFVDGTSSATEETEPHGAWEHPHWEALALSLAHAMALEAEEDLVLHVALHHDLTDASDDLAVVSCRQSCRVGFVHGLAHMEQRHFVKTGLASGILYGGFAHQTLFQSLDLGDFGSQKYWGSAAGHLKLKGLFSWLHPHARHMTDLTQFGLYVLERRRLPLLSEINAIVSMPGSGQSYVRILLELMSGRPTRALESFYARQGQSLAECFPQLSSVDVKAEPLAWVAHSIFEARKIAVLSEVRSLVVILRDYASLWLRTKLSKASLKMEDFVGEYMNNLETLPWVLSGKTLVLYFEELVRTTTLPSSLLEVLNLDPARLNLEDHSEVRTTSKLKEVADHCDEFAGGCHASCRNLKVAYGKSMHPQPSAPKSMSADDLSEIFLLEELLCKRNPENVRKFLLRKGWGSGFLSGCRGRLATFYPRPSEGPDHPSGEKDVGGEMTQGRLTHRSLR